jgi:hypothetical protein
MSADPRPDGASAPQAAVERRRTVDRRARPTRPWDALLGRSRRARGRRAGERQNLYVDAYRPADVLLVAAILVLNGLDALFTLLHLQRGGSEANPLMERLLEAGHDTFVLEKTLFVGAWLVLLAMHKNFRVGRAGLWLLLGLYAGILLRHLALMLGTP